MPGTRNRPRNLSPVLPKTQQRNDSKLDSPALSAVDVSGLSGEGKIILEILTERLDRLLCKMETKDNKIHQLQEENAKLKKTITDIELRIDEVENCERRNNIIVSGDALPNAVPNETSSRVAIDLFSRLMNFKLDSGCVVTAYRLGAKPMSQAPDRRRIMLKLQGSEMKRDIIQACRTTKPSGLFLNDDLTHVRATVLYALRRIRKRYPEKIDYCGSRNGKVFIWKKSGSGQSMKVFINSLDQLKKICDEEFELDPMQFVDNL